MMGDHAEYTARNVEADLMFWRRPEAEKDVQVDFTKGTPENNIKTMQILDDTHRVTVHDIRGQEPTFTLDKNGFTYLSHELPELDQSSDEECMENIIIPKTEELVRYMSVVIPELVSQD
jgi:hypothetical protein